MNLPRSAKHVRPSRPVRGDRSHTEVDSGVDSGVRNQMRGTVARFVIAAILVALCPLLMWLFSRPGASELLFPAYRNFSKMVMGALATIFSVVPFAVWDWLIAALVVVLLGTLIARLVRRTRTASDGGKSQSVTGHRASVVAGWQASMKTGQRACAGADCQAGVGQRASTDAGQRAGAGAGCQAGIGTGRHAGIAAGRQKSGKRLRYIVLPWLSVVALVVALIAFVGIGGWALNHYAPPLSQDLGLAVGQYSTDQLADATQRFLHEAASEAQQVPREEDGTLQTQDFHDLARIAGASYDRLADRYEVFRGCDLPVKALLLFGEPLLYSGHTGVFWAATGESSVPLNCATAELPFTMCHEAAHRLGIASEQEANFAAFLACDASDDHRLRYSGYYSAFNYCLNALAADDPDRAKSLLLDALQGDDADGVALVLADRAATSKHYDAYEGPAEDVGTTMNDTYLKSFGEDAGVKSYGLVVDYLLAWLGE